MWRLLLFLFAVLWSVHPCTSVRQVAVIGGGLGGASSAYYLRSLLGDQVNVTIFERHDSLGGRTRSWESDGNVYELGASMAWTGNHYMRFLAGEVGLSLKESSGSSDEGLFAVFDGNQLVFRQSQWDLLTLFRLVWRYGLSSFWLRSRPSQMFQHFEALYALQDKGSAFDRPEDFLKAIGCYELTQDSFFQYIREQFGSDSSMEAYATEIVAGIGRCNYNQNNLQLNALSGLVSLLPATDPSTFSIQGGNQQLAQRLAAKAGATVASGVAVGEVAAHAGGGFQLSPLAGHCHCQRACRRQAGAALGGEGERPAAAGSDLSQPELELSRQGGVAAEVGRSSVQQRRLQAQQQPQQGQLEGEEEGEASRAPASESQRVGEEGEEGPCAEAAPGPNYGPFDAVILATPLEGSGINLTGFSQPRLPSRDYQTTVTTIVRGALRGAYFGLDAGSPMPYTDIMVTESAQTPFSAIGQLSAGQGGAAAVYKLFSSRALEEGELGKIFEAGYEVLIVKKWKAYPRFDPPEDFAPFKLAEGLFYNNALENAASAMEIAAIAGRNSALLAARHLARL